MLNGIYRWLEVVEKIRECDVFLWIMGFVGCRDGFMWIVGCVFKVFEGGNGVKEEIIEYIVV